MGSPENFSLAELSSAFGDIGARLVGLTEPASVMQSLVDMAVAQIPGAEYAGITVGRTSQSFATVASTDDIVLRTDAIQYELGSGPCVDAILEQTIFNAGDLRSDARWPEFGRRAVEMTGITSMLSMRLYLEADESVIAGMNTYSHKPMAFDEVSETIATLLATHGALAVANATAREKARNLMTALESSREIGMAIGILMALHKVTQEQAFNILRLASQHTHRKVSDLAGTVVETGTLPDIPVRRNNEGEPG